MLESYFFIPANKSKFIDKYDSIDCDHIIFDLEDTVLESQQTESIDKIAKYATEEKVWVRPKLFIDETFDLSLLNLLIKKGFKKFVLPKLDSIKQVESIIKNESSIKWILLVEHPGLLLSLDDILKSYSTFISGIGIGTQDYCMYTGLKNKDYILNNLRFQVNAICSKHNKPFIDTASMLIKDQVLFEDECINAFDFGCSAKFIVHPKQLETLKKTQYFTDDEINWGKEVLALLNEEDLNNLTAISVNGILIEKPHLKRIKLIKKYLEKG